MQPARARPFRALSRACPPRLAPLHPRRPFSGPASGPAPPTAPPPAGIAELTSRKLISISGPDASKYLQGVITANLFPNHNNNNSSSPSGLYAAFLTAQGRILHDVFIYRDTRADAAAAAGDSWLIEVDAASAADLQKHIRRYKLRAKFDVRLLDTSEARIWAAWDDTTPILPPPSNTSSSSSTISLPDTRAPNLCTRLLTFSPTPTPPPLQTPPTLVLPESAYTLRRLLRGIPEGPAALSAALPHESNLDLAGAIDFRKGCYVGQELTIRTEHRGVVRKRVLPCLLYPDPSDGEAAVVVPDQLAYRPEIAPGVEAGMVAPGSSIGRVGRKGRSAGKWLGGVGNVGLAVCRLEIMTDVVLPGEGAEGGSGERGGEFVVGLGEGEEGGQVRIKAFVPAWLRAGLEGKGKH